MPSNLSRAAFNSSELLALPIAFSVLEYSSALSSNSSGINSAIPIIPGAALNTLSTSSESISPASKAFLNALLAHFAYRPAPATISAIVPPACIPAVSKSLIHLLFSTICSSVKLPFSKTSAMSSFKDLRSSYIKDFAPSGSASGL